MHASARNEKSRSRRVLIRDLHRDNNYHGPGERGYYRRYRPVILPLRCTRRQRIFTYFTRQSVARIRARHDSIVLRSFCFIHIYIFIVCVCAQLSFVLLLLLLLLPTAKAVPLITIWRELVDGQIYIYVQRNGLRTRKTIFVCFFFYYY